MRLDVWIIVAFYVETKVQLKNQVKLSYLN